MDVATGYHLLFRDENTFAGTSGFTSNGCFRGQLFSGLMKYKFNEHMDGLFLCLIRKNDDAPASSLQPSPHRLGQ